MITTGIIREINLSSSIYSCNKYLVELNVFQSPGNVYRGNYLTQANCSTLPGHYDSYDIGDKVYVAFINEDLSLPIIIGKIYQGRDDQFRSHISCQNLSVEGTTELSKDSKIGDISYNQLLGLFNKQPDSYYNHIVECELEDYADLRIKFKFMNRSEYKYSNFTDTPASLLTEIYRLSGGCTTFCDIYQLDTDSNAWVYQNTCLLRLTEAGCQSNRIRIESSVVQIENNEYSIGQIISDEVIKI